ncbi:hypothetical protein AB4Z34_12995 [Ensifer sp. 2YAB10]|uniref:ATP dependent DNA ligase n=1 Tax=unclassified Ensifer TaxID=2633371 RepID=UPI003F92C1D4
MLNQKYNLKCRRRERRCLVDPNLVAEVEFRAWTDDGKLRHASFKRLRAPANIAEVFEFLPD